MTRELIPLEVFLKADNHLKRNIDEVKEILDKKQFMPRLNSDIIQITFPVDWEGLSRIEDSNWRMQLQGWAMFFPMLYYFDKHLDKNKVIDFFIKIVEDWYMKYGHESEYIITNRNPVSYAWYDMSVGFRAIVLSFFINRISYFKINIPSKSKEILLNVINQTINNLSWDKAFSFNNHGIFQLHGLMLLIHALGKENYKDEKQYVLSQMKKLIFSQFDKNGMHTEHSPHYHFYAINMFEKIIFSNNWYEKDDNKEDNEMLDRLKKAIYMKKWLVDPYSRPPCIGDSVLTIQNNIDRNNVSYDANFCYFSDDKKFIYSNFNDSGYSVFKSHWNNDKPVFLFFMGMYNSKTHKHRDCQSFEWMDYGKKILCDGGKYGYKKDKYRKYFLSYKAHNTIDIENFDILKFEPYSSCIKFSKYIQNIFYLHSSLHFPSVVFDRKIYLKPSKYLIVRDFVSFSEERLCTQWFHLDKDFYLVENRVNYSVFNNGNFRLFVYHQKDINKQIYYGDEDNLSGIISEKDLVTEKTYSLGFSFTAKTKEIVTIFTFIESDYYKLLDEVDRFHELV